MPNSGTAMGATDGLGHPNVDIHLESEVDEGENYFSEQQPPIVNMNTVSPDPRHRYASQKDSD